MARTIKFWERSTEPKVIEAQRDRSKSRVRVVVTYIAAGFAFGGGAVLVVVAGFWPKDAAHQPNLTAMKDMFLAILPIAAGVITYWFADRSATKNHPNKDGQGGGEG